MVLVERDDIAFKHVFHVLSAQLSVCQLAHPIVLLARG